MNITTDQDHSDTVYGIDEPVTLDLFKLDAMITEKAQTAEFKQLLLECFEGDLSDPDDDGTDNNQADAKKPKHTRAEGRKDYRSKQDAYREMRILVKQAMKNRHTYPDFSLKEELARQEAGQPAISKPATVPRFDGSACRTGYDRDGMLLWIQLPNAVKEKGVSFLNNSLIRFSQLVQLKFGLGADKAGRNSASAYKDTNTGLRGVFNYVTSWTGIGHDQDEPAPSGDLLKTAKTFVQAQSLVADLVLLSHRINAILQAADPEAFAECEKLQARLNENAYARTLSASDPLLWVGRSIIFNRTTPKHRDRRDQRVAWTPLVTLGNSKGGDLHIPALGTDLFYEPGTIIFIRGGSFEHEVKEWTGEQRISIAHFTHYYVWEKYGLTHPF